MKTIKIGTEIVTQSGAMRVSHIFKNGNVRTFDPADDYTSKSEIVTPTWNEQAQYWEGSKLENTLKFKHRTFEDEFIKSIIATLVNTCEHKSSAANYIAGMPTSKFWELRRAEPRVRKYTKCDVEVYNRMYVAVFEKQIDCKKTCSYELQPPPLKPIAGMEFDDDEYDPQFEDKVEPETKSIPFKGKRRIGILERLSK